MQNFSGKIKTLSAYNLVMNETTRNCSKGIVRGYLSRQQSKSNIAVRKDL